MANHPRPVAVGFDDDGLHDGLGAAILEPGGRVYEVRCEASWDNEVDWLETMKERLFIEQRDQRELRRDALSAVK
jgi:hypothetical protein